MLEPRDAARQNTSFLGAEEGQSPESKNAALVESSTFPGTSRFHIPTESGANPRRRRGSVSSRVPELSVGQIFRPIDADRLGYERNVISRAGYQQLWEAFSSAYAKAFSSLKTAPRAKINRDDKSVANGMLPLYAQSLYQRLYRLRHLPPPDQAHPAVHVQANTEVLEARDEPAGVSVKARIVSTGKTDVAVYDSVILCTGLDDETILESSVIGPELRRRLQKEQDHDGYAVTWDGPSDRMIFVQS
jgi:hypothetical protein